MTTPTMEEEWGPAEQVPAFEAAIGLPTPKGDSPTVSKRALTKVSKEMAEERATAQYHREVAQVSSMFAKRAIRPDEIAALRRSMFDVVKKGLDEVDEVIMGKKTWSPTQVRLFAILTERVMPKLSNITVEDNTSKKLEDYTVEELEAIALGRSKAGAVDAVVKQAEVLDEAAEKHERRETKREVIRTLSYLDALSQAEKDYIARQVDRPLHQLSNEEVADAVRKYQPKFTPEQMENVRRARQKTAVDYWREQGFTEEQIAEKRQAMIAKRAATKAKQKAEKASRMAVTQGLDPDAVDAAKTMKRVRDSTLREFRVPSAKGVRKPTALAREAMERSRAEERREKRELAPRIYLKDIEGIPPEHRDNLTLDVLRQYRPDLFVASESGLGTGEGIVE